MEEKDASSPPIAKERLINLMVANAEQQEFKKTPQPFASPR